MFDEKQDDNETYQWIFEEKSHLLRNIKCIIICLQRFSPVVLHMFALHCTSLVKRISLCV